MSAMASFSELSWTQLHVAEVLPIADIATSPHPHNQSHLEAMRGLISIGSANIASALSLTIPAPTKAGALT